MECVRDESSELYRVVNEPSISMTGLCQSGRFVDDHQGFGGTTDASIAVWNNGIEIKAVAFLKEDDGITAAKLQLTFKNIQKFFASVVVVNDGIGRPFFHVDNERLHALIDFRIGEGLVLVADMGDMRSFGDPIAVGFSHHCHTAVGAGSLEEVADGDTQGTGDFQQGGFLFS